MPRLWFAALWGLLLVLTSGQHASARLGFVHEQTFTVPGLTDSIHQLAWGDIDGDGVPEVLIGDQHTIMLWSLSQGEMIFSIAVDSLLSLILDTTQSRSFFEYRLDLGDVNRDSVQDVCIALSAPLLLTHNGDTTSVVVVFDGAGGYTTRAVDYHTDKDCMLPASGLSAFQAVDVNGDGYQELLLSRDSLDCWSYISWSQWFYTGSTCLYHHFPDSILWRRPIRIGQLSSLDSSPSQSVWITSRYYEERLDATGVHGDLIYRLTCSMGSDGTLDTLAGTDRYVSIDNPYDQTAKIWSSSMHCAGQLDLSTDEPELLTSEPYGWKCTWYPPSEDSLNWDSTHTELILHRLVAPGSIELVWSKNIDGVSIDNFMYHPDFPGYFFAFIDGAFAQVRGSDGVVNQAIADIPEGRRYWDYPNDDGVPHLVVINGTEVSLYSVDIVTGVDSEDSPGALPTTFELGKPYPNPFNAQVTIPLRVLRRGRIVVDVYNPLGQCVARLLDREIPAGTRDVSWDAAEAASGVYLINVTSGEEKATVKVVLVK